MKCENVENVLKVENDKNVDNVKKVENVKNFEIVVNVKNERLASVASLAAACNMNLVVHTLAQRGNTSMGQKIQQAIDWAYLIFVKCARSNELHSSRAIILVS